MKHKKHLITAVAVALVFVTTSCSTYTLTWGPAPQGGTKDKTMDLNGIRPHSSRVAPTEEPTTELTPTANLASVDQCKIEHGDPDTRNFASGFPIKSERMPLTEKTKVAVLAVDFKDMRAKTSPKEDLADVTYAMNAFYSNMATKSVSFDFLVPDSYYQLPKTIESYDLGGDFFSGGFDQNKSEKYWDYVRAAIKVADKDVDFSDVKTIIVAGPPDVKNEQIGVFVAQAATPGQSFKTDEGEIFNVLIRGNDEMRDLSNWTHEMGHMLGLTDIRNTLDKGQQKSDGMGAFDLMANIEKPELLVWHRFLLGILNDNQINCVTDGAPSYHWIRPVAEKTDGVKGVVIPLGKYEGLIVESRRNLGYDHGLSRLSSGALVYSLDTTIKYGLSPVKVVPPERSKDRQRELDSALRLDESITYKGWKVTVVETGDFGDVIKVEKLS